MSSGTAERAETRTARPLERVVDWSCAHRDVVLGVVFAVAGLVVAWRVRPVILFDDAAIIARYMRRIVDGHGWTYNDGDRTNGLSAPLYGILATALHGLGLDPITSLRVVGTAAYAGTIGLVAYLGCRIVGLVGGFFAGMYLLVWADFARQGLSGMESSLAALLGMAVLVALVNERDGWAGALLGLALFNKLDAGLLALAVAAAVMVVQRRVPWRIAWISAAVLTPWLVFSTLYFGSPLPHSFTQKASGSVVNPTVEVSPNWILASLIHSQQAAWLLLLAALAAAVAVDLFRRGREVPALILGAALLWAGAHGLAFSLLDLGDKYPWYLTVLYPSLALCAGCSLGHGFQLARSVERRVVVPALVVVVAMFAVSTGARPGTGGKAEDLARHVKAGPHVDYDYLWFELARRDAGRRVAELAEPGEVVQTCFGWIAYEALENSIDETCPLNTSRDVGPVTWSVEASYLTVEPPEDLPGRVLVDTIFAADDPPTGRMDIFWARPVLDEPDEDES